MADIKITDLVDENEIQKLKELGKEIKDIKDIYTDAAKELAKGLKINVEVVGDLDKLNSLVATQAKKAQEATDMLVESTRKQNEIVAKTTNTISRELAEIEKENAKKRESFQINQNAIKIAQEVLGNRDQNLRRLVEINSELKEVTESQKRLNKQEELGKATSQQLIGKRAELADRERTLKIAKQELNLIINNEEKMLQAAGGSYAQVSLQLELMKKAYKQMTDEEKNNPAGRTLAAEIQNADARLKDLSADMGEFQRNAGNYATGTGSIRQEMRNLVYEISSLTVEYRNMSEEEKKSASGKALNEKIINLTSDAAKLKDAMADVNRSVSAGASDTSAFDSISEGINVIVSGFGAATGAAKLLGISEKDLMEIQTKLQATFVISNSLITIQNNLQKESALMTGIATIQKKALNVATNINTAAQGKNIVVTKAATIAQSGFNAIAKANPYVLLATAILTVVGAIYAFTKGTKELSKEQKESIRRAEEHKRALQEINDTVSNTVSGQLVKYEKLRQEYESLGNSLDKKKKFVIDNKDAFHELGVSVDNVSDAENLFEKNTQPFIESLLERAKAVAAQKLATEEYEKALRLQMQLETGQVKVKKQYKNVTEITNPGTEGELVNTKKVYDEEATKALAEQTYKETKLKIEGYNKQGNAYVKSIKDSEEMAAEIRKKYGIKDFDKDEKTKKTKDTAKDEEEIQSIILKYRKDTLQKQIDITKEGSEEELALRKVAVELQQEIEIREAESTFKKNKKNLDDSLSSKKITQEKYNDNIKQMETDLENQKTAIYQKAINEKANAEEKFAANRIKIISEDTAKEQVLRDQTYNKDILSLRKQFAEKKITQEQYEKQEYDLTYRYTTDTLNAQISSLEKMLSVDNLSTEDREKIASELQKTKAKLAEEEAEAEINAINSVNEADEEAKKKRIKNMQKWLQIAQDAIGTIGDLVSTIYDRQIDDIEKQQDANDEAHDKDIERIETLAEQGVITEEEAEARKRAAQAKTEAKNEELEKRKAAFAYKQAVWDKAASVAQTGIATALGIMQAMAMFPPNPILAGIIGAMGAIQVATILATPIPAYAKGTESHSGGKALVGDGGKKEVVVYDGMAWITPDSPTLVNLPKGAQVFPDVSALNWDDFSWPDLSFMTLPVYADKPPVIINDYKKLEKGVGRTNYLIAKGIMQRHKDAYNLDFERYKKSRL